VAENLADALDAMLDPVTVALIVLVCSRKPLRHKLKLTTLIGTPLLAQATTQIGAYLTAERGLGRIPIDTDVDQLAITLVGSAHLVRLDAHASTPADFQHLLNHLLALQSDPSSTRPGPSRLGDVV